MEDRLQCERGQGQEAGTYHRTMHDSRALRLTCYSAHLQQVGREGTQDPAPCNVSAPMVTGC